MCGGFPNCPRAEAGRQKLIFLAPTFNQRANIFFPFIQFL
ncbi:hypothetical protein JCM19300_2831 [Algibacter lectus]|uniref:Uncharacterized protein n=1 Tax=Algibacter lectus TaxID=221126 RepID=A0A090VK28_9FLAO|nr:hypothetical protein JCM19300_2831 [Algibacter lectus]